jgi:hypothetical protein
MAIRFLATNLWDTATVTASSAATGFPVTNIATRHFDNAWRSTGLTAEWLKADLGADTAIKAVVIKYSNLRVGDSLAIQGQTAANGDDWDGTPALAVNQSITITAAMVSKGQITYNFSAAQTVRYVRILMTATAHPDGYIRVGRVYLGSYVEPDRDYDKDFSIEDVDPSPILEAETGHKYVNALDSFKRISLVFSSMSAADKAIFEALRDALGKKYAFFVELDPASDLTDETYYVSCVSGWKITHIYGAQLYSMDLVLDEERAG